MTDAEKCAAAKRFAADWASRGSGKQERQCFWIELLTKVFDVDGSNAIAFEAPVKLGHTNFIDGCIESTRVLIEQKGRDVNLKQSYKQSDDSMLDICPMTRIPGGAWSVTFRSSKSTT